MADNQEELQDNPQSEATDTTPEETSESKDESQDEPQGKPEEESKEEPQAEEEVPHHSKDKRMERLSERLRQANQQADYYRDQLFQGTGYKPLEYKEGDYSTDQLEQDRKSYGQEQFKSGLSIAQQKIEQERFVDRLENDGEKVAQKYPILDEESDGFDPDLTKTVNELYLTSAGARFDQNGNLIGITNPSVRYRDFVEAYMASAERLAASRNADTAKNIASQASRAGVRPTASAKRGIGEYEPGKISGMSSEDYEKNREAIMADINRQLGI